MDISILKDGHVTIVKVEAGFLDASNAPAFKEAVKPFLAKDAKLVFDMSNIDFIDSTGLGALVSILRQAHTVSGEIKLTSLRKPARALFQLVRMHRVFEVFNRPEEAVSSYQASYLAHTGTPTGL